MKCVRDFRSMDMVPEGHPPHLMDSLSSASSTWRRRQAFSTKWHGETQQKRSETWRQEKTYGRWESGRDTMQMSSRMTEDPTAGAAPQFKATRKLRRLMPFLQGNTQVVASEALADICTWSTKATSLR